VHTGARSCFSARLRLHRRNADHALVVVDELRDVALLREVKARHRPHERIHPVRAGLAKRPGRELFGTLYSVLTGFTVIAVWEQFTDTDRAVKRDSRRPHGGE
jgi:hypothetical protein